VVGAASVELLVTGEDDLLPVLLFQGRTFLVLCFGLSSHAGETTVGVGLDVRVVWVSVFPDLFHLLAVRGLRAVHALFPLLDCTLFELDGIPLAANFDVSSRFDHFFVQWCIFFYLFRILEGTFGELKSFDADACHGR